VPRIAEQFVQYSVTTGRLVRILGRLPYYGGAAYDRVLWTSSSGDVLIVSAPQLRSGVGVLAGGHLSPLPWSRRNVTAAW
jgi:hypothetical protein